MHGNDDGALTSPYLRLPPALHPQRFRVIGSEPGDGFGRSVALVAECGDGAETRSLRTSQQTIDDLTLDQAAEEWNIFRSIKQIQKARARLQQVDIVYRLGQIIAAAIARFGIERPLPQTNSTNRGMLPENDIRFLLT